jgi:hypothetical protein
MDAVGNNAKRALMTIRWSGAHFGTGSATVCLFLKWNMVSFAGFHRFDYSLSTGAGEFHKHQFLPGCRRAKMSAAFFNLAVADTETAFRGSRQPPIPVIAFPSRRIPYLET